MNQTLEYLLARMAISDLPARYCDNVWREDIEGLVSLFSDEGQFCGVFDGKKTVVSGRKDLFEFFSRAINFKPRPYIHNHVVDIIDETTAFGRCHLDLRSAKKNMDWIGAGHYEDEYISIEGNWKFKSRYFEAIRLDELPDGINTD